jgi:quercetin dioxygenase-like cupin family protein
MQRYSTLLLAVLAGGMARIIFAQDPVKLSPVMYKVLLENEQVRVLEFRAKPGQSEPMHSHPAMTVYELSGGRVRLTTPDGKTQIIDAKPGTAAWIPATVHRYENVGTTETHEIVVELKNLKPVAATPSRRPARP